MFGIILLWQPPAAQASVSCTCSGSASINGAGQIVAVAASYTQTDFASACTDIGGTASGWTCSISNLTGPADSETQCTSATPASIAEMAGLPSSYSSFYSATGSCRLTDDSSSSEAGGWLTIVPKDCQDKDGCDICEVSKIFTNAANLIAGAVSAVALLMFILGGLFWIFSGGVESRVETGKKILLGTVSGLALVFVAWFGVNVIVRTAALSGGKATSKIFTSGTFSKEWWSFEGCYPTLPTTCEGLNIGAACGFGACSSGTYKDPNCQCYRASDLTGDTATCDGKDTADISVAKDTKKKQCMCTDTCKVYADTTAGAGYVCTASATVDAAPTRYDKNTTLTCAVKNTVCAKPKNP